MDVNKVFNRKKALIERDPLYKDFKNTVEKIKDIEIFDEVENITSSRTDQERKKHIKKYPDHWKLLKLKGELGFKWYTNLDINWLTRKIALTPYTNPEVIWIGSAPTVAGYKGVVLSDSRKYPQLEWLPYPNFFDKKPLLADINEFVNPGEKGRRSWLPILIDLRRLNKSSARQLKKYIWEIIDSKLGAGQQIAPPESQENHECAFLYSLRRESTFQTYLRWYDLHNEGKPGGFTFRSIAFGEYVLRTHPNLYDSAMEELSNKTKIVHSSKGQRTLKGIVGQPVKGEDAVAKGVKLIYGAIHRKPYSSKTRQKEYNCPDHGRACGKDCPCLLNFRRDFNKRNFMFKSLMTTTPEHLSQFSDEDLSEDSNA